jgi:hypothetical protein
MKTTQEVAWLLRFFSQPLQDQWAQLGPAIGPRWVRIGVSECEVSQPTRLLAIVLVELLAECGALFSNVDPSGQEAITILDELRVLLDSFILESFRDAVFEQVEEPHELYLIWRTVARICEAALQHQEIAAWIPGDLSLEWFVNRYTMSIENPQR